jgi:hypothetical protein
MSKRGASRKERVGQDRGLRPAASMHLRKRRLAVAGAAGLALAAAVLAAAPAGAASLHGAAPAGSGRHAAGPAGAAGLHGAASWKVVKMAGGSGAPDFTAVTATGTTSAWAFETRTEGVARPATWRLSESVWSRMAFPGHSGEQVVAAGSSSAANVWAVAASFSRSRTLRWNGSKWAVRGSIPAAIDDVAVISSANVWAFASPFSPGRPGPWHYNGHSWRHLASGRGLSAASALSRRSIWAVGGRSVAHWNGHRWSMKSVASLLPADTEFSHSMLTGIYARSAKDVWAVGTGGRMDEGGPAVVLHYNGRRWSRAALDAASSDPALAQVVPDGPGGLWIPVPSSDGIPGRMLRYSGGHLRAVAMPIAGARLSVEATAALPRSAGALAVGNVHRRNDPGTGQSAVILRYR